MLSNGTMNKLADALASEVVEYIFADERWVEFMQEVVPDAITSKMGDMEPDVLYELALSIMDRIVPKTVV